MGEHEGFHEGLSFLAGGDFLCRRDVHLVGYDGVVAFLFEERPGIQLGGDGGACRVALYHLLRY